MTLAICNGSVFIGGKLQQVNLLCENEKITKVTTKEVKAETLIDATDKIILPGVIDPHVHFRDPGLTHKEDFASGTRAAAKGGITTIFDMPNTLPPVTTMDALQAKREAIKGKSVINYGLHFGASQDNLDQIKQAKEHGNVPAVKVYCDVTTGNLKIDDLSILKDIFNVMPVTCLHAEAEHVAQACEYLKDASGSAYFCHISSKQELESARANPDINHRVFVEVSPHHLFMDEEDVKRLHGNAIMKPSLKSKADRELLWDALIDGRITTVGTDHAPHTVEEKQQDPAPFGVPGVETVLPLLLNAVNEGKLTLQRVVQLCSEHHAKIFGLTTKGIIAEGFDADLVIVDMNKEQAVDSSLFESKSKWSPFEGKVLKGWPVTTIVEGDVVYDNNKILPRQGKEATYEQ